MTRLSTLILALVLTGATPAPLAAETAPRRRFGCAWLALLLLAAVLAGAPASAATPRNAPVAAQSGAPQNVRADGSGIGYIADPLPPGRQGSEQSGYREWRPVFTAPAAEGGVGTALMAGNIGWAEPDLGIDYLATRFPRGTLVEICGPNACLIRRTNDYGPVASIRPNRIADLAVLDWEYICGLPRTRGLCKGTVETVAGTVLPATDTEDSWTP